MASSINRSSRRNSTTKWDDRIAKVVLTASSAKASNTADDGVEVGGLGNLILTLECTAKTGTNPTLDVTVETSADDGDQDEWRELGAFTQLDDETGTEKKSFPGADNYVRVSWEIGGTSSPGFTFSVSGRAS